MEEGSVSLLLTKSYLLPRTGSLKSKSSLLSRLNRSCGPESSVSVYVAIIMLTIFYNFTHNILKQMKIYDNKGTYTFVSFS